MWLKLLNSMKETCNAFKETFLPPLSSPPDTHLRVRGGIYNMAISGFDPYYTCFLVMHLCGVYHIYVTD